jgi:hypothetical protein
MKYIKAQELMFDILIKLGFLCVRKGFYKKLYIYIHINTSEKKF